MYHNVAFQPASNIWVTATALHRRCSTVLWPSCVLTLRHAATPIGAWVQQIHKYTHTSLYIYCDQITSFTCGLIHRWMFPNQMLAVGQHKPSRRRRQPLGGMEGILMANKANYGQHTVKQKNIFIAPVVYGEAPSLSLFSFRARHFFCTRHHWDCVHTEVRYSITHSNITLTRNYLSLEFLFEVPQVCIALIRNDRSQSIKDLTGVEPWRYANICGKRQMARESWA